MGVLVVLAATTVFVAAMLVRIPKQVGYYQDDGIYLVTAKALADGQGYRHTELPGEPYQTKYPILYPLLLAGIWRLCPTFPDNVSVVQIANSVLWGLGSWVAYRLMRRTWGLPWWLPAGGVLIAFLNFGTLSVLETALSESLYFPLTMLALATVARGSSGSAAGAPLRRETARGILAGLLAGATYLARGIGLTVWAAMLVHLALGRRWKALLATLLVGALVMGGWRAWCGRARQVNSQGPAAEALEYDLMDYGAWMPRSPGTLLWVAYQNTPAMSLAFLSILAPLPPQWLTAAPGGGLAGGTPAYMGMALVAALVLVGLASVWQRAKPALHLYLLFYVGVVLTWPFSPWRFVMPILPILVTLLLVGVCRLLMLAAGTLAVDEAAAPTADRKERWSARTPGYYVSCGAVGLIVLALGSPVIAVLGTQPGRAQAEKTCQERAALAKLLQTQTPPDAVICAVDNGYMALRTGRKVIPFLRFDNPIPHLYPADRRASECGLSSTPGERAANLRYMKERLIEYLRATGTSFVIPEPESDGAGGAFAEFRRSRPECFRRIAGTSAHALYRFLPPGR